MRSCSIKCRRLHDVLRDSHSHVMICSLGKITEDLSWHEEVSNMVFAFFSRFFFFNLFSTRSSELPSGVCMDTWSKNLRHTEYTATRSTMFFLQLIFLLQVSVLMLLKETVRFGVGMLLKQWETIGLGIWIKIIFPLEVVSFHWHFFHQLLIAKDTQITSAMINDFQTALCFTKILIALCNCVLCCTSSDRTKGSCIRPCWVIAIKIKPHS